MDGVTASVFGVVVAAEEEVGTVRVEWLVAGALVVIRVVGDQRQAHFAFEEER